MNHTRMLWTSTLTLSLLLVVAIGGCGGIEPDGGDRHSTLMKPPIGSGFPGGGEVVVDPGHCDPQPYGTATYACAATATTAAGSPLSGQTIKLQASWCKWCSSGMTCTPTAAKTAVTGSDGKATVTLTSTIANRLVCTASTSSGVTAVTATRTVFGGIASGFTLPLTATYPAHALPKGQWLHLAPLNMSRATLYDVVASLSEVGGNPDLYMRYGAQPTLSSYRCRPFSGDGQAESCKPLDVQGPKLLYVSVHAREEALFNVSRAAYPNKPLGREYIPGEAQYASTRPSTWNIEWDGHEGLDFAAYDTVVRAPFVQNVTNHSATVVWRVSVPSGTQPTTALYADATIAPVGTSLAYGTTSSTSNGKVTARVISAYNKYENLVTYNKPAVLSCSLGYTWLPCKSSSYWLDAYAARPVVELRVTFNSLQPDKTYHYQVRSQTVNPATANTSSASLGIYTLAKDVHFRTAPQGGASQALRFLAMGDLGPGDDEPSYVYDVFDLFHNVARRHGASLWVAMGDIDNDTDGHPNAMDPFFFNLYNAYANSATLTSGVAGRAKSTSVAAFRKPPYLGLLGGLPVYPTMGNHDICTKSYANSSSYDYWYKAQRQSFVYPAGYDPAALGSVALAVAAKNFNDAGQGLFYTFRQGDVYFISLGIPKDACDIGGGKGDWKSYWGIKQSDALEDYLYALRSETAKTNRWVVVYFHADGWATGTKRAAPSRDPLSTIMARGGVDLVLAGHAHEYREKHRYITVDGERRDFRVVVAGTGGFGDDYIGSGSDDPAIRPGFVMVEVEGNKLRYWKYDTHQTDASGKPLGRNTLDPRVREFRTIEKLGRGRHAMRVERDLNRSYTYQPQGLIPGKLTYPGGVLVKK
jgi:hypothetical protein